jgi:hypothetical protein
MTYGRGRSGGRGYVFMNLDLKWGDITHQYQPRNLGFSSSWNDKGNIEVGKEKQRKEPTN